MSVDQPADDADQSEASEDEARQSVKAADGETRREGEEERTGQRGRRRGRRGGRRARQAKGIAEDAQPNETAEQPDVDASVSEAASDDQLPAGAQPVAAEVDQPPEPVTRTTKTRPPAEVTPEPAPVGSENSAEQSELVTQEAEPLQESKAKPAPRRRARHRAGAGEPRLERVVVGPAEANDDAAADTQNEESALPARKGWWQRRLGGE